MEEKEVSTKKTKKTKKEKKEKTGKKFKFKFVYIILIIFVLCVGAFAAYLLSASNNDGPVYGDRCAGMVELSDDVLTAVVDEYSAKEEINTVSLAKECRTLKVDIDFVEGTTSETIQEMCRLILVSIDEKVGYTKNNETDAYSYLFTTYEGVQQYHVDFTLTCTGNEDFPAFATKHPQLENINFTFASIKNPDVVDELLNPTDETHDDTTGE